MNTYLEQLSFNHHHISVALEGLVSIFELRFNQRKYTESMNQSINRKQREVCLLARLDGLIQRLLDSKV